MGPKKVAPPKKKAGDPENGGELTPEEKVKMYMLACQSLQMQLAERSEESSKAIAAKRELQTRVEHLSKDFEEEKKLTFDITKDMTRQYKGMQEELLSRINQLEETVSRLDEKLLESDRKRERMLKEKDSIISLKDQEIADLKSKMDDMAEEFGEMLRETLEKMRDRIEVISSNADAPELPIAQRLEEIKLADRGIKT